MIVVKGWCATVVVVFLVITTGWAQDPITEEPPAVAATEPEKAEPAEEPEKPEPEKPEPEKPGTSDELTGMGEEAEKKLVTNNTFIVPSKMDDNVDVFGYKSQEYLVVNKKRRYKTASLMCKIDYNARLAVVADKKVAHFLAEALSETNLIMDALWTAGRTTTGNREDWFWDNGANHTIPIKTNLVDKFSSGDVTAEDRHCLAFARLDHDLPDYRKLTCNAERAVLCERAKGGGDGNSTHPGWIKLGKRLYKIFSEKVSYDRAAKKCFEHDPDAQLAVIVNFNISQLLGRYLLINRPSLENAWIGARWNDIEYSFEPEPIALSNKTQNSIHWPPWRTGRIQKVGGCILLDRHLANTTLFVEARCERDRGYICYKPLKNETGNESVTDIIIGDHGYRLHYGKRSWENAVAFCKEQYPNSGPPYLSEIPSLDVKHELLYVMGENRTAVQHIWLGGKFTDAGVWKWVRDSSPINLEMLDMVNNSTYNDEAESLNTCLNMDRENHIEALHYGADCAALQHFVCSFTKDQLIEQQKREEDMEQE